MLSPTCEHTNDLYMRYNLHTQKQLQLKEELNLLIIIIHMIINNETNEQTNEN